MTIGSLEADPVGVALLPPPLLLEHPATTSPTATVANAVLNLP